jgi:hypothetical protein
MMLGIVALLLIGWRETVTLLHVQHWGQLLEPGAVFALLGSAGVTLKAWLTPTRRGTGEQGSE